MAVKLIGDDSNLGGHATSAGYITMNQWTASSNATLSEIRLYAYTNDNMRVAVYSDSGNEPNTLLTSSGSTAVTTGANTIAVSPISIVKGTKYWLAFQPQATASLTDTTTGGIRTYKTWAYGVFENPFTTPAAHDTYLLSLAGYGTIVANGGFFNFM